MVRPLYCAERGPVLRMTCAWRRIGVDSAGQDDVVFRESGAHDLSALRLHLGSRSAAARSRVRFRGLVCPRGGITAPSHPTPTEAAPALRRSRCGPTCCQFDAVLAAGVSAPSCRRRRAARCALPRVPPAPRTPLRPHGRAVRAIASNAEQRGEVDSEAAGSAAASPSVSTPATPVLPSPEEKEKAQAVEVGGGRRSAATARNGGSQPRGSGHGGCRATQAFPRESLSPAPRRGIRGVADVVARPRQGAHRLHAGAKRCWSQPGGGRQAEPPSQGPGTFSFAALHVSRCPAPRTGAHSDFHGVGSLMRGGARSPPRAQGAPPACPVSRPGGEGRAAPSGGTASDSDVEEEAVEEEEGGACRGGQGTAPHPAPSPAPAVGVHSVLASASQGRASIGSERSSQSDPVWLSGLVRRAASVARRGDEDAKACSLSVQPAARSQTMGHAHGAVSAVGRRVEAAIRAMHHAGWMLSREGGADAGRAESLCLRLLARQGPNRLICRVHRAEPSGPLREGSVAVCCVHAEAASAVLRTVMPGAVVRVREPWCVVPWPGKGAGRSAAVLTRCSRGFVGQDPRSIGTPRWAQPPSGRVSAGGGGGRGLRARAAPGTGRPT